MNPFVVAAYVASLLAALALVKAALNHRRLHRFTCAHSAAIGFMLVAGGLESHVIRQYPQWFHCNLQDSVEVPLWPFGGPAHLLLGLMMVGWPMAIWAGLSRANYLEMKDRKNQYRW